MKLKKFLVLLLVVIWISSATVYVLYKGYYKEIRVSEFDMDITVSADPVAGLNVDTDSIHFGSVSLRGGSERHLNITNSEDYSMFVWVEKDNSPLSSIVSISPNYLTIKPGEIKQINVEAMVPDGFELGDHKGKVTFYKRVPFYR